MKTIMTTVSLLLTLNIQAGPFGKDVGDEALIKNLDVKNYFHKKNRDSKESEKSQVQSKINHKNKKKNESEDSKKYWMGKRTTEYVNLVNNKKTMNYYKQAHANALKKKQWLKVGKYAKEYRKYKGLVTKNQQNYKAYDGYVKWNKFLSASYSKQIVSLTVKSNNLKKEIDGLNWKIWLNNNEKNELQDLIEKRAIVNCHNPTDPGTKKLPKSYKVHRNIKYKTVYKNPCYKDLKFDVITKKNFKKRPVLVWVHGGGWTENDKNGAYKAKDFIPYFVNRGMVFVSLDFRSMDDGQSTYQDMAADIASALKKIKNTIHWYGGDANQIVLLGHSSGAHLVSLVSTDRSYLKKEGLKTMQFKGVIPLDVVAYDVNHALKNCKKHNYPLSEKNLPLYFSNDKRVQDNASSAKHVKAAGNYLPQYLIISAKFQNGHPTTLSEANSELFLNAIKDQGKSKESSKSEHYFFQNEDHSTLISDLGPKDKTQVTTLIGRFLDDVLN